jgi:adenosylcobinamide-phosphate synthase
MAAFALDLACGDPRWLPHPVRMIGWSAERLEGQLERAIGRGYAAGLLFTLAIVGGVWAAAAALVAVANDWDWRAGIAMQIVLLYTTLAVRDLDVESRPVFDALAAGDLREARSKLSRIVGRDTAQLDEPEIVRATVETIAESTVDGIVSPLVFALLGGAPAALAYKAINTLDSMVGHRDDRYERFGWASARLDDAANFIPARLSRWLFPLAAAWRGLSAGRCWRIACRDGHKSPSPNAGIPEAAMAGALGVQLGGTSLYDGEAVVRPQLGDALYALERKHIPAAIGVMYAVALLALTFGVALGAAIRMAACRAW